jgi:nucleoside-diphosphate-sugar epimerase
VGTLVDAALREGVARVIHDTVVMVYAGDPEGWLTEASPVSARGPLHANLAAEQHLERLTSQGGIGVALRLGQLYGPSDDFSRSVARAATRGWSFAQGSDQGWTSALHTDDIGPAVCSALDVPAGVYNVVDDEPMRRGELVQLLARSVGRPGLRRPPAWTMSLASEPVRSVGRSQRVSAARFTGLTGWHPTVPSRREGWPAAIAALVSDAPGDSTARRA